MALAPKLINTALASNLIYKASHLIVSSIVQNIETNPKSNYCHTLQLFSHDVLVSASSSSSSERT